VPGVRGLKFGAERLVRAVQHAVRREREAARAAIVRIVAGWVSITSSMSETPAELLQFAD
jgi:hypothetical protein